jgi:hypothetical protein
MPAYSGKMPFKGADFTPTLTLPPQGGGEYVGHPLTFLGWLGGRSLHFAHSAGFTAGGAFLGFAAGVHLFAAFVAGKDGHGCNLLRNQVLISIRFSRLAMRKLHGINKP